ncbi:MAG TPA: hypothetical protein VFI58_02925 [Xanthobacteraceae bacterium]|jgi:hypothetical protein|nr:hypothetical protein [Xanthobacteraceae bacterium]
MLTLRALAIVITGAGVFAALPVTGAQACDDDRYPCPIRVPQETVEAPAQAAPAAAAQPQRKVSHPARANAKPQAKREQEAPRAAARAKPSKPAVQEQAAEPISQKGADAAPAMEPPRTDQSAVAAAGTAWPALATTSAGAPAAANADATEAAQTNAVTAAATDAVTNAVQVVDKDEVNDLDRAAAASGSAESSWLSYLLLILGTALAAAAAFWFVFKTASRFARRPAHPRMHMSRS